MAPLLDRISDRLAPLVDRYGGKGEEALLRVRRRVATVAGAVLLGLAALVFAKLGDLTQRLFAATVGTRPLTALLVTPLLFALVVHATLRWVPGARGSGIPQVIAAARDPQRETNGALTSVRTGLAKVALTLLMLAGGGSVGREGPTVQLSAAIMVAVHRALRVPISAGVLIAGGAAGVAAAFNTPLAGIAFAIEELASAYEQRIAVLVMAAVMVSGLVSLGVAGDYIYFGQMGESLGVHAILIVTPVAGIVGGLAGGLFSRILLALAGPARGWARSLKAHPVLFAAGCGLLVAVVGLLSGGKTWGTGYATTRLLVEGHAQPLWFGPAKFVASLATALSGAPGGVFAPSLAVGAGVGNLLSLLFPASPSGAIILLGIVAYFVGVVRAPLTAVIIISETTASRGLLIPLFAAALIADAVSTLVCREKLYHGLARAFLAPEGDYHHWLGAPEPVTR